MAVAHINFFEEVGRGTNTGVPVFDGTCSQDRVDITTIPAAGTVPAAQAVVGSGTKYAQIVSPDAKVKCFVGSTSVSNVDKEKQAAVLAPGATAMSVMAGQSVHVWLY